MNIVEELPRFSQVEIVPGAVNGFYLKSVNNDDVLNKPFETVKAAVQYSVGAFLIVKFSPGQIRE